YIYSNAFKMNQTGEPLMQALVMDYQDDPNVYEIGDQYLFGNELMVCPVTVKGAQTRTVYLPEGEWYDWWSGKKYAGRQYIHVVTPLDTMPVFAKAGAIIPQQPAMRYVGEKKVDVLTLDVFPGKAGAFLLYEDDGESLAYQQNAFSTSSITVSQVGPQTELRIAKPNGLYKPGTHQYLVKLHTTGKPKTVQENGKALAALASAPENKTGWYFSEKENILYISAGSDNTKNIHLLIRN
ncbi:MAG TPA: DUF5110 domain-containing protein, partial [Flavisolibacter sp.]|nr:DUF5110 domain-containing protein [Flavisolibacter sp.]